MPTLPSVKNPILRRASSGIMMEAMENRVLFATTAPVLPPPPPPPPKPGVTLTKGVLSIVANPKVTNTITVDLSKDGKNIDVSYDGKSSVYKVINVHDVKVLSATKTDKVTVHLTALAPKKAPPIPPPPTGVTLKNGVLTIADNPKINNAVKLTLSTDGKSINVFFDGKTSTFKTSAVSDITVFDGPKNDSVLVALGSVKLKHPVLIHGGFGTDTITGGVAAYDLSLAPPPPPATT